MKNCAKKIILLIILCVILILSGCTKVTLTVDIDNQYNTSYSLEVIVDTSKSNAQEVQSISSSLGELSNYYMENGYTTDITLDNNDLKFSAIKSTQCSNYTECFEVLYEYMTSETSPLQDYNYELNQHHFYYEYVIDGNVNTNNIVSTSAYTALPSEIKSEVDEKLTQGDFKLVFNLPNQTTLSEDARSKAITNINIPLNKVTNFHVEGKINNEENLSDSKTYIESADYYKNLVIVFSVIIGILLVIIIFALIKFSPKKKESVKY